MEPLVLRVVGGREPVRRFYDPIPVPAAAHRVHLLVDLSRYAGKGHNKKLLRYGVEFSSDLVKWELPAAAVAGDNAVPNGMSKTSTMSTRCPKDTEGKQVWVRPFIRCSIDVGLQVRFLWH